LPGPPLRRIPTNMPVPSNPLGRVNGRPSDFIYRPRIKTKAGKASHRMGRACALVRDEFEGVQRFSKQAAVLRAVINGVEERQFRTAGQVFSAKLLRRAILLVESNRVAGAKDPRASPRSGQGFQVAGEAAKSGGGRASGSGRGGGDKDDDRASTRRRLDDSYDCACHKFMRSGGESGRASDGDGGSWDRGRASDGDSLSRGREWWDKGSSWSRGRASDGDGVSGRLGRASDGDSWPRRREGWDIGGSWSRGRASDGDGVSRRRGLSSDGYGGSGRLGRAGDVHGGPYSRGRASDGDGGSSRRAEPRRTGKGKEVNSDVEL